MGLQMVKNGKGVDPEKLSDIGKPEIISELNSLGAAGTFSRWEEKDLKDFLIELIDPEHKELNHLHSECR